MNFLRRIQTLLARMRKNEVEASKEKEREAKSKKEATKDKREEDGQDQVEEGLYQIFFSEDANQEVWIWTYRETGQDQAYRGLRVFIK